MIPKRGTDQVTGTLDGRVIEMTLNPGAARHLMGVLTGQYSDPELASVREISTNAFDAHIEAGQTRPIEVETPNDLHTFLTIRDFGTGLSADDIEEIYSSFGASTKRDSNEFNGCLGIGCKAPLAYAQQFTLTSVKDGWRIQVSISKNAEGGGTMTVVHEGEDKISPNGTEIQIPCRRYNEIKAKAERLFSYWPEGSVLLDGVAPKRFEGRELAPGIFMVHTGGYGAKSTIVMGNVPYPAEIKHGLQSGWNIVAYVGMGDVEFAPSRESLVVTHQDTIDTLERIQTTCQEAYVGYIQTQIDACDDPIEALKASYDLGGILPRSALEAEYTWRGEKMPRSMRQQGKLVHVPLPEGFYGPPKPVMTYPRFVTVRNASSKLSGHDTPDSWLAEHWQHTLFFEGYDRMSFTAGQRKKIDQYLHDTSSYGFTYFVLIDQVPTEFLKWIPTKNFASWEDVAAIKLERAAYHSSGRIPGSYDLWKIQGGNYLWQSGIPSDEIDADEPIYYCLTEGEERLRDVLVSAEPDCTLVVFNHTRENKFKRTFPEAKHARTVVQTSFDAWKAKIKRSDLEALRVQDCRDETYFQALDVDRVDDPEIKRAIRATEIDLTWLKNGRTLYNNFFFNEVSALLTAPDWTNPLLPYPLIGDSYDRRNLLRQNPDHIYMYLNAVYALTTTTEEA
jgi:Histidine kinase-, DNA gyrase B-, and HSP90-like ATPase